MKRRMFKHFAVFTLMIFLSALVTSCDVELPTGDVSDPSQPSGDIEIDTTTVGTRDSTPVVLTATADGVNVMGGSASQIDVSNAAQGYIMVKYTGTASKVKMQVKYNGGEPYNYDLNAGDDFVPFPLSSGSGDYTVTINENISGTKYAIVDTANFSVTLENQFGPFLYPSQYVNFTQSSQAVSLGEELARSANTDLEALENIYNYVIGNVSYDYEFAETQKTFYIPNIDTTLTTRKGICFDYAVLMTAMLRSQNIPTQLVLGYAGKVYHAWISVYTEETGWISNVIQFNGSEWVLMDPTFASTGSSSPDIMEYIGDGENYNALYFY